MGQVVIPIMIGTGIKHVSFRLVPKLKSTSILGTDMIKNLKMTLNCETGTWWLPGSSPTRYHMEAKPHSLSKPLIENTTSDKKKATKTSKEDNNKTMKNKINSNNKILTSVNNRIKAKTKSIENNNEELKPKFWGKIKLKSRRKIGKTVVGRNRSHITRLNLFLPCAVVLFCFHIYVADPDKPWRKTGEKPSSGRPKPGGV